MLSIRVLVQRQRHVAKTSLQTTMQRQPRRSNSSGLVLARWQTRGRRNKKQNNVESATCTSTTLMSARRFHETRRDTDSFYTSLLRTLVSTDATNRRQCEKEETVYNQPHFFPGRPPKNTFGSNSFSSADASPTFLIDMIMAGNFETNLASIMLGLHGSRSTANEAIARSLVGPSTSCSLFRSNPTLGASSLVFHASHSHMTRAYFSTSSDPSKRRSQISRVPIPTPSSAPPDFASNPLANLPAPKSMVRKAFDFAIQGTRTVLQFLFWQLPKNLWYYAWHPGAIRESWMHIQQVAKDEIHHYWTGTKLLVADVRTARGLLNKTLRGNALTRRERKQLLRTVSDLFRVVPFSMFLIIPFMEFALPFVLRIFPNLLPSTFQDSLKAEENMKRELKSRIAMAQFFQETLEGLAKEQKRKVTKRKHEIQEEAAAAGVDDGSNNSSSTTSGGDGSSRSSTAERAIEQQEDSAASMLEFLEKARNGVIFPPDVIIRYATYFQDDFTLDNMPRMQLINMCKYMSIPPYGSDDFLRFQLRHKIRVLREDDQRILWEGIESLTKMELREACQERGMRSTGLSKDAYKSALQQWLELSVNKNVPIALLIMSRTFFLREDIFFEQRKNRGSTELSQDEADLLGSKSVAGIADAISGLHKEVVNEVILDLANSEEKSSDPEIRKLQLEVVSRQNELIREEERAREAAAKKKETEAETDEIQASANASSIDPESVASSSVKEPESLGSVSAPKAKTESTETVVNKTRESAEERDLSTQEMDALRHLISDDPVSQERAELERIKLAMKGRNKNSEEAHAIEVQARSPDCTPESGEPMTPGEADRIATDTVEAMDAQAAAPELSPATTSTNAGSDEAVVTATQLEREDEVEPEDPVVARLKKRVESMVDKIELQLSDAKVKIGDKLHFLDKDRDGILSTEEMVNVLQQVLKRKITPEEAMEITDAMDENHDGIISVDELINWIDTYKLVKYVEEGRDADMDRIMEDHADQPESERKKSGAPPTD